VSEPSLFKIEKEEKKKKKKSLIFFSFFSFLFSSFFKHRSDYNDQKRVEITSITAT